ncbi:MAG: ABC-2 family transporter protein [Methanomassiliicoccales archaeon PtaU1.Bin124]|nr:MAG: ABC-2 family transporter protein [Methanomassiliicoccales archaeon PtaU1.Bin124]
MSGPGRIMKKEIKELLTPATIVPIIIMAVLFASLGGAFNGVREQLENKPEFGLAVDDAGTFGILARESFNSTSNIIYNATSLQDGLQALQDGKCGQALVYIPGNYTANLMNNKTGWVDVYWMKKGTGLTASVQTALVQASITSMGKAVSTYMIVYGVTTNSSLILSPIQTYSTTYLNDKVMPGITPDQVDTVFTSSSLIVPLIVMLVVIMAGSMVINSMGSEKENKTLETLLTMPVKRTWIVFGKLAGATVVGLIVAGIYMIGMGYYLSSLMAGSTIDLAKYGLTLGMGDYVVIGVSLFLALLCGLALCMILGIFTKNFKAAQTMVLPVTMLAIIPMLISMFSDFNSLPLFLQIAVFAIPFSHPMFAFNNIMMGNYMIVFAGIAYMAVFALAAMFIAVYLFRKDILLTGRVRSAERKKGFSLINLPGWKK